MNRSQLNLIRKDLSKKLVLLAGPRQAGKTFIAKALMNAYQHPLYLNYDDVRDRKIMLEYSWLPTTNFLVLDELHKMPDWKNYLKGLYDNKPIDLHILVTGSARLEIFNKLGDSLAGRYFLHRLLPLSLSELKQLKEPLSLSQLLIRGGFPEPYLAESELEANRWRMQYINSMLSTDIFEFEKIQNMNGMRTLFELLRTKTGSPISYQSLSEDIAISPMTVKKYIEILEALYIIFRVTPFSKNIARSLLKEPKIYFLDNGLVKGDEGAQLENLIAVSLLKHVYGRVDYHAENYTLHYLRTKEGIEVDFLLAKDNEIESIIEAKNSDHNISKSLNYFHQKYELPATQLVQHLQKEYTSKNIAVRKAEDFLADLFL